MNYKKGLVQLMIGVALTLTILQFFTTTITFSDLGNKMLKSLIRNESLKNSGKLKIVDPNLARNQSKNVLQNKSHVSKKFAKLTHRHKVNQRQKQHQMRKEEYTILFWGKFYGYSTPRGYCMQNEHSMDFCEYKCKYSFDQWEQTSDAVVIHGRDNMEVEHLPSNRPPHQRWVFLMFESPKNSWINLSRLDNLVNWTMSYRQDSDVFIPYGKLIPRSEMHTTIATESEEILQHSKDNLGFKKLAAWAVSNCEEGLVTSERKAMVTELSKFMPIDVYGTCGLYVCPGNPRASQCDNPQKCFKHLGPRYKFYFAFENSICEDYITEKFFLALANGMVPVVHGPRKADYLKHVPEHSFIHVEDFPNLKKLAEYLTHLDENDEEYLEYFRWTEDFVIDKVYYFQRAWCNLCKKLHEQDDTAVSVRYSSIQDWWLYKGNAEKKMICKDVHVSKNATFEYQ